MVLLTKHPPKKEEAITMKRSKYYHSSSPTLYLVATPIGNKKEFSPRAIETLQKMDYIGCEDTRTSGILFHDFEIHGTLISCHEHNENEASEKLISFLNEGKKVAYVSDAGYPGISDPGHRLVIKAIDNDINVVVIGGSSAFLPALIGSGLPTDHFYFHGFLASKESSKMKELEDLADRKETLIFYESPHRIITTLENMLKAFGNRSACIARELTKIHEEYIRGTLEELSSLDSDSLKGEMVIIVEGEHKEEETLSDDEIITYVNSLINQGLTPKSAIKETAKTFKLSKNYVYNLVHNSDENR